jgi:40S ribosome biogenesis protein Tsr1 and BMS1 C-terminal
MLAVQKAGSGQAGWRVSATGVVTGIEAAPAVVKKLKLVGHPFKVFYLVFVLLSGLKDQVSLWSCHGCRNDSRG